MDAGEPVVLLGDSGTGKSHLLIDLGFAACEQGRRVRYATTAQLVNELVEAADERQLSRVVGRYGRLDLLCLDELGYVQHRPPRRRAAVPDHHRTRRTSLDRNRHNLPFSEWGTVFPDRRLVAAIVDRVTFNAHILETGTQSYRLRTSKTSSRRRRTGRHPTIRAGGPSNQTRRFGATIGCARETSVKIGAVMQQRTLGRTGVSVSQLCLGAMMFGSWGNPNHDECIAMIHAAMNAGITFIDTADVYGTGESEEIIGEALTGGRREDVVLATKFHNPMGEEPNRRGNSRRWIVRAVEDSLRRLSTDWIDLYQVHRPDPSVDIEETLGALTDLVRQGKVRYIGGSTFPASQIVEAQWASRERNLERFVTEQPPYSILVRGVENDVLPTCQRHGMAVMSLQPTGGRLVVRALAKGHRSAGLLAREPTTRTLRPRQPLQPAQA